jgi:hypothetical protein
MLAAMVRAVWLYENRPRILYCEAHLPV